MYWQDFAAPTSSRVSIILRRRPLLRCRGWTAANHISIIRASSPSTSFTRQQYSGVTPAIILSFRRRTAQRKEPSSGQASLATVNAQSLLRMALINSPLSASKQPKESPRWKSSFAQRRLTRSQQRQLFAFCWGNCLQKANSEGYDWKNCYCTKLRAFVLCELSSGLREYSCSLCASAKANRIFLAIINQ